MLTLQYSGKVILNLQNINSLSDLKVEIGEYLGLLSDDYYLLSNGKLLTDLNPSQQCSIDVIPRLLGGKGGFGSMLRAIGAQIEKTTNREACRDLSGRRLRDINEEKRLKTWIAQQVEREQQVDDRKQKKLERLCQVPKHEFRDEKYEEERSKLPEMVEDALEQGLKASQSGVKRKQEEEIQQSKIVKKKKRLWIGESDDELSSSSDDNEEKDETSDSTDLSTAKIDQDSNESIKEELNIEININKEASLCN